MRAPVLLDLFCKAGGATKGYQRAGFYVVGVDIEPQPHYCGDEFVHGDAVDFLAGDLSRFAAIHASPPCQGYSRMRHLPWLRDKEYPLLIEPVRDLLQQSGLPWAMENVEDAPLTREPGLFGVHGVMLCGTMFGLDVYRHRPFESNIILSQPEHPKHRQTIRAGRQLGDRARVPVRRGVTAWQEDGGVGGHMGNVDRVRAAMGIDWMIGSELSQAIPPAYTEHIGRQLMAHVLERAA